MPNWPRDFGLLTLKPSLSATVGGGALVDVGSYKVGQSCRQSVRSWWWALWVRLYSPCNTILHREKRYFRFFPLKIIFWYLITVVRFFAYFKIFSWKGKIWQTYFDIYLKLVNNAMQFSEWLYCMPPRTSGYVCSINNVNLAQ